MRKTAKKDAMMALRVTEDMKTKIKKGAAKEGRSVSSFTLRTIVKGLRKGGLTKEEKAVLRANPV